MCFGSGRIGSIMLPHYIDTPFFAIKHELEDWNEGYNIKSYLKQQQLGIV